MLNTHMDHIGPTSRMMASKQIAGWVKSHGCGPDAAADVPCDAEFVTGLPQPVAACGGACGLRLAAACG